MHKTLTHTFHLIPRQFGERPTQYQGNVKATGHIKLPILQATTEL